MSPTDTRQLIDARGLKCPLPVLKLEKYLGHRSAQLPLTLLADDPVARIDIPVVCNKHKLACAITQNGKALRFEIDKKGG